MKYSLSGLKCDSPVAVGGLSEDLFYREKTGKLLKANFKVEARVVQGAKQFKNISFEG